MGPHMTVDWSKRWADGRIGFHSSEINPRLSDHLDLLTAGEASRVLVPLCGKSLDMKFLRDRGHEVVGVEMVEPALEAFFAENDLSMLRTQQGGHPVFTSEGITAIASDFFDVSPAMVGTFECVWDRAAMVALPPELRDRYAEHLTRLVAPGGRILMVTFHYDPQRMSGPPFSLGGDEIEARFSERFEVRTLADDDWLQHEPHWANRGLDWLKVGTFLLTRRS
jgi:thiopurine S-methyltransferase